MKPGTVLAALLPFALTAAHAAPGDIDLTFNVDAAVRSMAIQSDGKILVGGGFSQLAGASRRGIGRLNSDGSPDTTFWPSVSTVYSLAVQTNGRIVIAGSFSTVNGVSRNCVARLNVNGSLDAGFNPGAGPNAPVSCVAIQNDGKVLIGGSFTMIAGVARNYIARLNSDGSLDTTFNNGTGADGTVNCIAVQTNGNILIGGSFTNVNGISRPHIARLNPDESLDTTFNSGSGPNGQVNCILVQGDGKILVGGNFSSVAGTNCNGIARLGGNGTVDTNFNWVTTGMSWSSVCINSIAVQNDGKALIGGRFTSGSTNDAIAMRLTTAGAQDSTFNVLTIYSNLNYVVLCLAVQTDGKLLMGGGPDTRPLLFRLRSDAPFIDVQPSSRSLSAPGGVATFTVAASGISPLYYQWLKDGSIVAGATTSSLTLTNLQPNQTGNYSVVVTNTAGSTTSASAPLSLFGAPLIMADGQVVAGTATRNYSSTVTLQMSFPSGYIFYTLDGTPPTFSSPLYSGPFTITNSTTVRALSLSLDFSQSYPSPPAQIQILKNSLTLTGGGGCMSAAPSQPLYENGTAVTLTAFPDSGWTFDHWQGAASGSNNPVTITMDASKQVQAIFTTTVLTNTMGPGHIELSAYGPIAYGTTLQLRAIPDPGNMFVVWGSAVSGTANPQTFTVSNSLPYIEALFSAAPAGTPTITAQPVSQCTGIGSAVSLSITASGAGSYQWRLNGNPIPGATGATLSLTNLITSQAGNYDVLVTGPGGSVLSTVAKLVLMDFNLRPVVSVLGNQGTAFQVQYSDTISNGMWLVLTNGILPAARLDVIDFSNTNTQQRFYRVVLPAP